ncbi:DNA helicase MCM8 [Nasonia vitripennis]|uniref:DNA helicase MCM8 n=1 Tax=Nasonia vitripennis TaxID=7425 RepID=A0A7M7GE99_NASVI|nr:DNA helicase MCM8 [Nasonia vitripennis]XP_008207279.1 DNA helicase MCM8 [Nasonia vitripennis]
MSGHRRNFNPRWKKYKKKTGDNNNKRSSGNNNEGRRNAGEENEENSNDEESSPRDPTPQASNPPKSRIAKRDIPYSGWNLYFDEEEYKKNSPILEKIQTMEAFLQANPEIIVQNISGNIFNIDVNILYNSEIFLKQWPDFKSDLTNNPQHTLNCLGLAVHKIRTDQSGQNNDTIDVEAANALVKVKVLNYEPLISLKNIKVNYYGKLITVRGCIIRVNRSCHMPSVLVILCSKCKLPYPVKQKNGIYVPKKKCDICGGMKFEPDLMSPYVETIPLQVVRIQEHFGEENDDQGRVPRVMDVELFEDLVDTCMPGDDVTVTGIIKMQGTDNGKVKVNAVSNCLYMEAISVVNNNTKTKNSSGFTIELNTKDYKYIKDIHSSPDILSLLVNSLCPGIYGHEMIKMALLLSLFGGSSKHANLRDNIHLLIVGDPGLGKSQMLQACARVAPKGIYVSGNSSTSSGLTVTLVREKGESDFALEPGALVLADRGCCCIDEFDKMPTQHQSLLEAMEQQSVSVAKSGVIWSLPSRTSILAAANPIGGRYDRSKALCNNLNMSQPLLSRFDLIFLLLDQPDKDLDNFLSEHVMMMHTGHVQTKSEEYIRYNRQIRHQADSLKKRLIATSRNSIQTMPSAVLRKYISYARQYVKPRLSSASATLLQKYYLDIRKKMINAVNLAPCNRQLEALIRLTEARAKLDLREETTEQDALDVVELLQHTVLGMNNEKIDYTFLQTGKTSRSAIKTFLQLLVKDAEVKKNNLYTRDELKNLAVMGKIASSDVPNAIDKLNEQGFLIKKANDLYKFSPP